MKSRTTCVQLAGLWLLSLGCGVPPLQDEDGLTLGERSSEIRPTDGTGYMGNGYGIPALSYDPPGGHFRVFYVTTGENAVDLTDENPKDGVPDFVALVGQRAEATYDSTVTLRGFRAPLDDSVYHDRPDFGGDGRFDIYLRMAGRGSDGYRVTEVCTDGTPTTGGGTAGRCAGYFVMNPTYKGSRYPSDRDAVEVLTSHELFHSIQDAYSASQWRTFTEATAVWNELQVFPQSAGTWRDYLGFLPSFFSEPERPFDQSRGSGPSSGYSYGAAAWVQYLSERFGPSLIREIWEGCEQQPGQAMAPHFLDVTDDLLTKRYRTSLVEEWREFTRWNLLTGERATASEGYQRAKEYPLVRVESAELRVGETRTLQVYGLSARYLRLAKSDGPRTLDIVAADQTTLREDFVALSVFLGDAPLPLRRLASQATGRLTVTIPPGETAWLVMTGIARGAKAREINLQATPTPPTPDLPEETGCRAVPGGAARPSPRDLGVVSLGLLAMLRFRRRRSVVSEAYPHPG